MAVTRITERPLKAQDELTDLRRGGALHAAYLSEECDGSFQPHVDREQEPSSPTRNAISASWHK